LLKKTETQKTRIKIEGEEVGLRGTDALTLAVIKDANPEMYKEVIHRRAEMEARKVGQKEIPFEKEVEVDEPIKGEVTDSVEEAEIVDTEHEVFEKIDVAAMDPELWKTIEKFTTVEEVYNQAIEFNEAGNFNAALSVCLIMFPKIEASKEWTPEYITNWFNLMVLKQEPKNVVVDEASNIEEIKEDDVLGEEFNEIKSATNKHSFKKAISAILQSKEDNKLLRDQIINAINSGTGSHTRQVAKMPDGEKHKQINNIKEKIGKFQAAESN